METGKKARVIPFTACLCQASGALSAGHMHSRLMLSEAISGKAACQRLKHPHI
jgi:hypothetical protein